MSRPRRFFPDRAAIFASFAEHLSRGKAELYRQFGLDAVMGERGGARFADAFAPETIWWNCHSNGGVFNLGHRHPAVLAAVSSALEEVDIGNHHLPSPWRARLAERLVSTTDDLLPGVVFGVSGGEAVDLSIKVARAATRRSGVVSVFGGYHGHTGLALAAGDPAYRDAFGPNLPGFTQVPFDDLEAMDRAIGDDTACVLLEPIPATLGMPIPHSDYLPGVAALCRDRGARLILDEVQTGLGRTGTMWCYQQCDVVPDAVVTGKGLSGGVYPVTATLLSRDLHALFDSEPFIHISTFGGAEPGCAAALAVLDILEEPGFLERVRTLGDRFEARLASQESFSLRRRGMMMALALDAPRAGQFAAKMLYDRGVFAAWANNDDRVLQFLPPLVIADEEVDAICDIVCQVLP